MKKNKEMKLHHIGYITGNIDKTAKSFELLGYVKGNSFDDAIQKCLICFLQREGCEPLIELVQPYDGNKTMQKMLSKYGVTPYHLCYEVEDLEKICNEFSEIEGWIQIFAPVEAVAFDMRRIAYFMNAEIGFVELVEK